VSGVKWPDTDHLSLSPFPAKDKVRELFGELFEEE
jgi:hypothetical protein